MIIWIIGQPGAGKTTLGKMLADSMCAEPVIRLDGDELRTYFSDTDYSKAGRINNIRRAMGIALFLEAKGMVPVCSFVSPYREQREWFKAKTKVVEIYLEYNNDRGKDRFAVADFEKPNRNALHVNTSVLDAVESLLIIKKYIASFQ